MNDKKNIKKTPSKISKDDLAKLNQVIETIEKDPKSFEFLEPVDYVGLGLEDYLVIIKKPMDLSTLKKKIKLNKYNSTQEALEDIHLIWSNCKAYNAEGSDIYKLASYLEKLTKKTIEKIFKSQVEKPTIKNKTINNDVKEESQETIKSDQE